MSATAALRRALVLAECGSWHHIATRLCIQHLGLDTKQLGCTAEVQGFAAALQLYRAAAELPRSATCNYVSMPMAWLVLGNPGHTNPRRRWQLSRTREALYSSQVDLQSHRG